MTVAEFFEMPCGVCKRLVVSSVGPPRLGELVYRVDPDDPPTGLHLCLDCAADLIRWLAQRAEDR